MRSVRYLTLNHSPFTFRHSRKRIQTMQLDSSVFGFNSSWGRHPAPVVIGWPRPPVKVHICDSAGWTNMQSWWLSTAGHQAEICAHSLASSLFDLGAAHRPAHPRRDDHRTTVNGICFSHHPTTLTPHILSFITPSSSSSPHLFFNMLDFGRRLPPHPRSPRPQP